MTRVEQALGLIRGAMAGKDRIIVAIDGPCASGKTTLAEELHRVLGCPVIHMDEFFLRPEQRTAQRLSEAGGNVDRERFLHEVLTPLTQGRDFTYRPFLCKTVTLGDPIAVKAASVTVVEGSYSCHPSLREAYDLRLFLSVDPTEQVRRLLTREGPEKLAVFRETWIPMEEKYFTECDVKSVCVTLSE